ncbi:MAG TPA: hypothetical protein VJ698_22395 [Noviherbaspirillum sp.]|uniref:hypothetical protein n=1 Tax=Noviherbaspirillum sp. TaxID=1926288 RepID=UPI002B49608C|nr:hypothetical protein [Noviherbaspirillum sp.]HJV88237.1 hypothetical protein [Noviherbaspirillum sp.]
MMIFIRNDCDTALTLPSRDACTGAGSLAGKHSFHKHLQHSRSSISRGLLWRKQKLHAEQPLVSLPDIQYYLIIAVQQNCATQPVV